MVSDFTHNLAQLPPKICHYGTFCSVRSDKLSLYLYLEFDRKPVNTYNRIDTLKIYPAHIAGIDTAPQTVHRSITQFDLLFDGMTTRTKNTDTTINIGEKRFFLNNPLRRLTYINVRGVIVGSSPELKVYAFKYAYCICGCSDIISQELIISSITELRYIVPRSSKIRSSPSW